MIKIYIDLTRYQTFVAINCIGLVLCSIFGNVLPKPLKMNISKDQLWQGSEQPILVKGVPAQGWDVGNRWSLWSLQSKQFYDSMILFLWVSPHLAIRSNCPQLHISSWSNNAHSTLFWKKQNNLGLLTVDMDVL